MHRVALRITAAVAVIVVAALLAVVTGLVPRGPMNHGWDWPWHDWWHSGPAQSEHGLHGRVMTDPHMMGSVAGRTASLHEMYR